ncbi:MAG: HDOD domain-containing protein [Magnetococcales bacterium]|nr:HDOD domain-containing protein [Magnetococcales bacterium]
MESTSSIQGASSLDALANAEKILKIEGLPPQPRVVMEIHEEIKRPVPNLKRVSDSIGKDPGLSAKLIKLINSPFYGLPSKVTSIQHALGLLGLEGFAKFVMTTALQQIMGKQYEADQRILDHCVAAAVVADKLAGRLSRHITDGKLTPDLAYLTGLFHDCGIPLLVKRFPKYAELLDGLLSHSHGMVKEEELRVGTNHCAIGSLIAKSWYLPNGVVETIRHHHSRDFDTVLEELEDIRLTAVLKVADYIAHHHGYLTGSVQIFDQAEWDSAAWSDKNQNVLFELDITPDFISDFKEEMMELLGAAH